MTAPTPEPPALDTERPSLRHGLAAEWPLLAFTLAATLLISWLAAAVLGATPPPLPAFLAIGAAAMAVSALHLGRPVRAWRAIAGLRTSWVSREVAAFATFMALGSVALATGTVRALPGWLAAAAGLAALVSVDMVYRVRGQRVAALPHSAMTTLTWALLVAVLLRAPGAATLVAIVKVLLYQRRHRPGGGAHSLALSSVRLVVGLLIPLAFWPGGEALPPLLLAGLLAGEAVDRAELYGELAFLTPRRQAERDLDAAVRSRPAP